MLKTLAIAVNVTDKAIFPLHTWVIRLLTTPPGQDAKIINPTAVVGFKSKLIASEKPIMGNKIN
jgi:hypothetical protein